MGDGPVEPLPILTVGLLEVGDDEVVLGGEVAVEAHPPIIGFSSSDHSRHESREPRVLFVNDHASVLPQHLQLLLE